MKESTIQNTCSLCPICSHQGWPLRTVTNFSLWKCAQCALEYVDPMPDDATLLNFYKNYHDVRAQADVVSKNAQQNFQHLVNTYHLPLTTRILDYGAGRGLFSKTCRQSGYTNSYCFDKYGDGTEFSLKREQVFREPWDVITLWGVLEHLTDPLSELSELVENIRPGGLFAATTVHIEGPIPYRYKPPEHTLYFSQASITALADYLDLQILDYAPYHMIQRSDVYMSILTRTMPPHYRCKVHWELPEYVNVPTNEIFMVLRKPVSKESVLRES